MSLAYPPPAPVVPETTAEEFRDRMHQRQVSLTATVANLPQMALDVQANFAGAVSKLSTQDAQTFGMACYAAFVADKDDCLASLVEFLTVVADGLNLPGSPVTAETLAAELLALTQE